MNSITIVGGIEHLDSATLNNAGTITQTAGRLDFNGANSTLNTTGLYEVKTAGDGPFVGNFSGSEVFNNYGTLRRDGTGTARFDNVVFNSGGAVEVLAGGLQINTTLTQLTAGKLTAGTWRAANGGTLIFPANVTANAATIVIEGTGAIPQLGTLAMNIGSLSLLGGADLTTAALTNTGTIVLGADSVLTVNGAFAQTAGRLELQLAGAPASGQFGRVAITGAATFAGTLAVRAVNAFAPGAGDSYTLLTHASRTGAFEKFEGLDQSFAPVFEFVSDAASTRINSLIAAADLSLSGIVAPASGFIGRPVTISYTVTNLVNRPTTENDWTDSIYLSRDGALDESDFLFARVPHTDGLGALGSYTENIVRNLPGALEGDYQVTADNRRVAPDFDRANNQLLAPGTIAVDIERLTLGAPVTGTIADGANVYFRVDLASGTDVFLTGDFASAAEAEFLVRFRAVPDRTHFDFKASNLADLKQQIRLLNSRRCLLRAAPRARGRG